ncbi:hypothetical protein P154DRAFT_580361 [Amniculicola lignicola CBS 123094]|uniref:Uncharacterized protein n=1 Tax=Amniculicola lignicola CBS 123094 TaxID=1392246 RepID=A0A6A5W2E8_9PLEO|nr:hypothetical protein P154DRAFT_580361 [Amniculicola lignicola CBS 123094]
MHRRSWRREGGAQQLLQKGKPDGFLPLTARAGVKFGPKNLRAAARSPLNASPSKHGLDPQAGRVPQRITAAARSVLSCFHGLSGTCGTAGDCRSTAGWEAAGTAVDTGGPGAAAEAFQLPARLRPSAANDRVSPSDAATQHRLQYLHHSAVRKGPAAHVCAAWTAMACGFTRREDPRAVYVRSRRPRPALLPPPSPPPPPPRDPRRIVVGPGGGICDATTAAIVVDEAPHACLPMQWNTGTRAMYSVSPGASSAHIVAQNYARVDDGDDAGRNNRGQAVRSPLCGAETARLLVHLLWYMACMRIVARRPAQVSRRRTTAMLV